MKSRPLSDRRDKPPRHKKPYGRLLSPKRIFILLFQTRSVVDLGVGPGLLRGLRDPDMMLLESLLTERRGRGQNIRPRRLGLDLQGEEEKVAREKERRRSRVLPNHFGLLHLLKRIGLVTSS